MTVSTEINHEEYAGNGVTYVFPYRFRILKASNMIAVSIDVNGIESILVLDTDFSISGVGDYAGGNVTLQNPLPAGWGLTLTRELPAIQETDLRNQGTFFAETHENAFDYLTMLIQQVSSWFALALRKPTALSKSYDAKQNRIANLSDPTNPQDAVNNRSMRNYVDQMIAGVTGGFGWFIQSSSGAVYRTFQDKMRDVFSANDYGLIGDGVANDNSGFVLLEAGLRGRRIDLLGKTYLVDSVPSKNTYYNGAFRLNKTVTTSGIPTPYTWDSKQSLPDSALPLSVPSRDYRGSMATQAYYINGVGGQSIAFDEPNALMYIMLFDNSTGSERSYLSAYDMSMRYPQPATALWSTNPSALLGHQGLGLEYITNAAPKLWGCCRYDEASAPAGHRQVIRFNAAAGADISNIQQFTLFGIEFAYTGNSTMCTVSYDQKYLVACGRKTTREFWIRVFMLDDLIAGGTGDYSSNFTHEFQLDQDILADDMNGNFTPVQNMACDGTHIYFVAGNSGLTQKKIHQYSLSGVKCDINNTISVGLTNATSDGSSHEPEGICIYRPQGAPKPMLAYLTISASGNRTRIWDLGYSPLVVSGSWTPTGTSVNNIATLATYVCNYQRIGNVVNFSGRVNVRNTISGAFEFQLSLPTYVNAVSLTQAQGVFIGEASEGGRIQLDAATNTLDFLGKSVSNVTVAYSFSGSYRLVN
ncbi:phage baseplate protein [Yersinia massiliensis]|uniref:phage baseplate protein n=1 Tax=Yersinia massiliensis TaxID=419257 RepID=UPI00119D5743|nr:hypothetical protein [Yersinia massiliensis]